MEFKPKNQPWKKVFVYYRQMLSQDPPATQDLQQTNAKAQLLMHAKHEAYNHITQQKHPFKCHTSANSTIT